MLHNTLIIGTGPAALMAADHLSSSGINPVLFERRRAPGWKLLVAGISGLNVTYDADLPEFSEYYREGKSEVEKSLNKFSPNDWLQKIHDLGLETFRGTSRRFFLKAPRSSPLLRAWIKVLVERGVLFHYNEELKDFKNLPDGTLEVAFHSGRKEITRTLLLALGGASWENSLPGWIEILKSKKIDMAEFKPSNAGFHLQAPKEFFLAAEGTPIKGLTLKTPRGEKQGELMITRYGLEGTPIYSVGCEGPATIDLKPDLTQEKLQLRLQQTKGGIMRRIERSARLSQGALLMVKFLAPMEALKDPQTAAQLLKNFPIILGEPRPLSESISSRGGVAWSELSDNMELKKNPGVFCAGEMINWDAPTGGFLIQACVSTGYAAAEGIIQKIRA